MWLNRPHEPEELALVPLLRARSNKPVSGELCGDPLRVFVHFAVGRSWPCTGFSCTLCKRQVAKRFYAYYPVRGSRGGTAIIELTGRAEGELLHQMNPHTDVPSGFIKVSRLSGKKNMPCKVEWKSIEEYKDTACVREDDNKNTGGGVLSESELKTALMRIWKLPTMNGEQEEREYLAKLNETIRLKTTKRET